MSCGCDFSLLRIVQLIAQTIQKAVPLKVIETHEIRAV